MRSDISTRTIAGRMQTAAAALLMLGALALAGCGTPQPTSGQAARPGGLSGGSAPTPVLPAAASPAASQAAVTVFTNQNWGLATNDPVKYAGSPVTLTGQVFNVEQDGARVGLQMWTDPLRGQGNTVVIFPKEGFPEVQQQDQIRVQGTLQGVFNGKTDTDEALKLPRVQASQVEILGHGGAAPSASVSATTATAATGTVEASATTKAPATTKASAAPEATATVAPTPTAKQLVVNAASRVTGTGPAGLTIRDRAALSAPRIGFVKEGGLVVVVSQTAPGWAHVRGQGFEGYVYTGYLAGPVPAASAKVLATLGA